MTSGLEHLRHELAQIDEALRAFHAPIADELPGTRLMRHVLEQRRSDVDDKLRNLERCQITVRWPARSTRMNAKRLGASTRST